jgi:peptide/nickel transport system substrate-binding protein
MLVAAVVRLLPKHVFEKDKGEPARNSPNNLKPVGTGAYKVADFKPGDSVTYVINENYREPNKPFFDRVEIKGGGDATSAARAVLQSGDYDYAWNLQVTDQVIRQLESGGKGVAQFQAGGGIERILINFTDHNKEVDGERASLKAPHPFLTDLKVRQALALASDRETVNRALYGRGGEVATNILYDPPRYRSNNIKAEFNVDKANALLEEAGWKKGPSGYREKGGVVMAVLYQTSINDVRQKTQEIIKASWEKIGVKVELKSIDSNVFFSSDAGNPDTLGKFYADVQMYNSFNSSPDPQSYMRAFHGKFVNTRENKWSAGNVSRYQNPAYDALWEQSKTELDPEKRAQLFIQMNDVAMQDVAHIPLNYRKVVFAHTKNLQGINFTPWEEQYWNIGDWSKS